MKIVVFKGGLGNQLFQYAFYKYLSRKDETFYFYNDAWYNVSHNGFELDKYFKDFHNYIPNCEYIGCNHVKEVNCGIKDAVASGQISEVRYQSYCKIYNELKQKEEN